jgi:dTDP-4-amino-4,6-dideoxygalactose transaminase
MTLIPFNKPYLTGNELENIQAAYQLGKLAGDGDFTQHCHTWLEEYSGCKKALLTHSCTAALEMCAILADIRPGDEVIMPSYTFVSTANAFVLRGGTPVFVDIREDTLNLDESLVEAAISPKSKAIVAVHYAGVSCNMRVLRDIADRHGLILIEDAAQGLMSFYEGHPLGSLGDLAAISFHETKNVISGEGGALLINKPEFMGRAEIIREKGTNRSKFFRGEVDKYTWVDIGSSYLPGELIAAFLYAQLRRAKQITQERLHIWEIYHRSLESHEQRGLIRRPIISPECLHNGHLYYILLGSQIERDRLISLLRSDGINSVFHYVPLHSSPAGKRYGKVLDDLIVTDDLANRLVRLPLWLGLDTQSVLDRVTRSLSNLR